MVLNLAFGWHRKAQPIRWTISIAATRRLLAFRLPAQYILNMRSSFHYLTIGMLLDQFLCCEDYRQASGRFRPKSLICSSSYRFTLLIISFSSQRDDPVYHITASPLITGASTVVLYAVRQFRSQPRPENDR